MHWKLLLLLYIILFKQKQCYEPIGRRGAVGSSVGPFVNKLRKPISPLHGARVRIPNVSKILIHDKEGE